MIPQYICQEYTKEDFENGSVYLEFINNINNEQLPECENVLKQMISHLIKSNINQNNFTIYSLFYNLFKDIKKSMCKNFTSNDEFLFNYFELSKSIFKEIYSKNKTNANILIYVYLAIFYNIVECTALKNINQELYRNELNIFYKDILNQLDSAACFQYIIASLFIIELNISQNYGNDIYFKDLVVKLLNKFINESIGFLSEEKNGLLNITEHLQNFMIFSFIDHNQYETFNISYNSLLHDLSIIYNKYSEDIIYNKENISFLSCTFLLYNLNFIKGEEYV